MRKEKREIYFVYTNFYGCSVVVGLIISVMIIGTIYDIFVYQKYLNAKNKITKTSKYYTSKNLLVFFSKAN